MNSAIICAIIILLIIIVVCVTMCVLKSNDKPEEQKEGFLSIHGPAKADGMGAITGESIYTDSTLKMPYEDVLNAVKENRSFNDNEVLGAGFGDGFDGAYNAMREIQTLQSDPTGVRSQEEMAKVHKQMNHIQGNNGSCIFNRGGTTKAKLKLEPMGTAGVCQEYTPERDRNHEIRMVRTIIDVPGYDLDTNRIQDQFDSQGKYFKAKDGEVDGKQIIGNSSVAQMFSPNVPKVITAAGHAGNSIPGLQESPISESKNDTISESFTSN